MERMETFDTVQSSNNEEGPTLNRVNANEILNQDPVRTNNKNEATLVSVKKVQRAFSDSQRKQQEESDEWLQCAKVIERSFLVLWFITCCIIGGCVIHVVVKVNREWDSIL